MGCCPSSYNQISSEYIFTSKDISYLIQSWSIVKAHDDLKFAQDVFIRTSNENVTFRNYWRTKILVEGNNYDYGQHESCLRSDSSWHVGFQDYTSRFLAIFDQLLLSMKDPNRFFAYVQSIATTESLFLVDYQALLILKKCMLDLLHDRWKIVDYTLNETFEKVWEKFLTYLIDYITKLKTMDTPKATLNSLSMKKE